MGHDSKPPPPADATPQEPAPSFEAAPVEFLRAVVGALPAFVFRVTPDFRIAYINRVQPGLDYSRVIGSSMWDYVPPDRVEEQRAYALRAWETGETLRFTTEAAGPHGEVAVYDCRIGPAGIPGSRDLFLLGIDVTEHRRVQAAREASEQLLKAALAATGIGLWTWDARTDEVVWDDGMRKITGIDTPLRMDRYVERLVHADDREIVASSMRETTDAEFRSVVHRIVRPDGEVRWVMPAGHTVRDASGALVRLVGSIIDVTDQRAVEEQLRASQKMEAVGGLTAGVAHNFNNMLAAILPSLEMLRASAVSAGGGRDVELADNALHAAQRAADMVRQLMAFAGGRTRQARSRFDLAGLVGAAVAFCRRTFDARIHVELQVASGGFVVEGAPDAIEQVLVNLLLNARDAVEARGVERPRIDVLVDDAPEAVVRAVHDSRPGPHVRVRVVDNGCGVEEQLRERLFEPFFTTKPVGRGTGLGLAVSYRTVKDHGGSITCESEPGLGSTFTVLLPAASRASTRIAASSRPPVEETARRVLVVDDEAQVRTTVARVLESRGHFVRCVGDHAAALAALAESQYDVVLLDRSMPDAAGDALVPRIRTTQPSAGVLFFTGLEVEGEAAARVDGVVLKPATADELESAVVRCRRP